MTTDLLDRFVPLAHFLGAFLGPDCEVVLHDARNIEQSVRVIVNGHISGRQPGAPMTDLALRFIKERTWETEDFVQGYKTNSRDGRQMHSGTLFIQDDQGGLAGMLCVNLDESRLVQAKALIDGMLNGRKMMEERSEVHEETFSASLEDLTGKMIVEVISGRGIPAEQMSPEVKQAIVQELNDKGVFLLKGAVAQVAQKLAASEPTIYRYLQKVGG